MFFRRDKQVEEGLVKPKKKVEENEYEWDIKKVLIALIVLGFVAIIGLELKNYLTAADSEVLGKSDFDQKDIAKPSISTPQINIENKVGSAIENIKANIDQLNAEEVASSSPQIQKVLKDIQGIKDLPASAAKETCLRLCSEL